MEYGQRLGHKLYFTIISNLFQSETNTNEEYPPYLLNNPRIKQ